MGGNSFVINNKGYAGTGGDFSTGMILNDFWEYNPVTDTWSQKTNVPGNPRENAIGFSVGMKGYVQGGYDGISIFYQDLREYDPLSNTWSTKAAFPRRSSC